ncbi:unnamed protein product [Tetraodon nigroviridis]|uniref:(spotted green pufferfish) hypothetical protein n=1 Tax=Tetraodon nigroviridis TaxID=99883 RepID=Q4TC87_TETNG|nr:unnamed protein product [Tetraodon nigroviridis]
MLYLEDYLEMIEQLPMDLRDRFTEMREMDLQVQNATDQLEQKVNEFFVNAKKNKPEWREEQMEVIKKDYYKALEDADEKVQLANQIYDLVSACPHRRARVLAGERVSSPESACPHRRARVLAGERVSTPESACPRRRARVHTGERVSSPESACPHRRARVLTGERVSSPESACPRQRARVHTGERVSSPESACPQRRARVHTGERVSTPESTCPHRRARVLTGERVSSTESACPHRRARVLTGERVSTPESACPHRRARVLTGERVSTPESTCPRRRARVLTGEDFGRTWVMRTPVLVQVDRHLRKLDQELAKFKMELEADNAGITEILERREHRRVSAPAHLRLTSDLPLSPSGSLEMDSPSQPVNNHHVHSHATTESKYRPHARLRRLPASSPPCVGAERKYSAPLHHTAEHVPEKKFKSEALLSTLTSDASKENAPGGRSNSAPSSANSVYSVTSSQPLASYNLSALPSGPGAGAGAITMAAAQAVQATAQVRAAPAPEPDALQRAAATCGVVADEGGQEDVQPEGQLRGHQEQRLPAGPRVLAAPGGSRLLLLRPGLHPHPEPGPQHRLRLQGPQVQVRPPAPWPVRGRTPLTVATPPLPGAASSPPTTSRLRPPPPPRGAPAPPRRRWPRNCPSRPRRCGSLRPTARWTGPTTPTSLATASATSLSVTLSVLQVSYGEMVGCDNTDVSAHTLAAPRTRAWTRWVLTRPACLPVSHRVVPLRLRGPDGGPQREVVLSPVHGRHEEAGQPAQVDAPGRVGPASAGGGPLGGS